MKILFLILLITLKIFALDINKIVKAHDKALKLFRIEKRLDEAIRVLEEAGVKEIIKKEPPNMSFKGYITVLNNYGFFLSETKDRYEEGIPILKRVIKLSPKRFSVYINIGDAYYKLYQKTKDKKYIHKIIFYYENYLKLVKNEKGLKVPDRIHAFIAQKVKYPKLLNRILENLIKKRYRIHSINSKSCKVLLKDLLNYQRFIVLKPDIKTNNYYDKNLIKELGVCHNFDLHYSIKDKSMLTYLDYNEFIEDKINSHELSEAKWDFRLYKDIEIDNNGSGGEEMIFYAGGFCTEDICKKEPNNRKFNDKIYLLNKKECENNFVKSKKFNPLIYTEKLAKVMPYVIRDNKTGKMDSNIDEIGIAEYRGKYYIYRVSTIKDINDEFYSLFLIGFKKSENGCKLIEFEIKK